MERPTYSFLRNIFPVHKVFWLLTPNLMMFLDKTSSDKESLSDVPDKDFSVVNDSPLGDNVAFAARATSSATDKHKQNSVQFPGQVGPSSKSARMVPPIPMSVLEHSPRQALQGL